VAIAETSAWMTWRPAKAGACWSCWELTVNRALNLWVETFRDGEGVSWARFAAAIAVATI
jgi:hypothetical protein